MMRQLLLVLALLGTASLARAADSEALKTNSVTVGMPGTLEMLTPPDWTLVQTNLNLPDHPVTAELHSPSNRIVIRLYIRWDGFGGTTIKPTDANMAQIVSNNVVAQYLPMSVEKTFRLEKFHGPAVKGTFARLTDAGWAPVLKDEYPNLTEGMFRSGNLWGNFNLLTFDKDGPQFKAGLKILESLRRKP